MMLTGAEVPGRPLPWSLSDGAAFHFRQKSRRHWVDILVLDFERTRDIPEGSECVTQALIKTNQNYIAQLIQRERGSVALRQGEVRPLTER